MSLVVEQIRAAPGREMRDLALPLVSVDPQTALEEFVLEAKAICAQHRIRYSQSHSGSGLILAEPRWIVRVLHILLSHAISRPNRCTAVNLESIIGKSFWRLALEQNTRGSDSKSTDIRTDQLFKLPRVGQGDSNSLALALCKSIVTLHGGRIWAESCGASEGLRLVFTIPTSTPQ